MESRMLKNGSQVNFDGAPGTVVNFNWKSGKYQVQTRDGDKKWVGLKSILPPTPQPLSEPVRESFFDSEPSMHKRLKIDFSDLPRASDFDGQCNSCKKFPNPKKLVETNIGMKMLVICSNCGNIMRPFALAY
jgi:hypothetical protein